MFASVAVITAERRLGTTYPIREIKKFELVLRR
jgi:hypothetical protein